MPENWEYSLAGLFKVALFDEAQELRNPLSFQNVAGQWLECPWNVLLTGTPWYNRRNPLAQARANLIFAKDSYSYTLLTGGITLSRRS
jgi:hypothetical protein